MVTVQATAGMVAGACSSVITTPIDTVKTRLQVCEMSLFLGFSVVKEGIDFYGIDVCQLINWCFFYGVVFIFFSCFGFDCNMFILDLSLFICNKVMDNYGSGRPSVLKTAKNLIKEDGWWGFYRGFGPRFLNMSLYGTTMIVTYELISMSFLAYLFWHQFYFENG